MITKAISIGYTNELLAAADLNSRCATTGGLAYLNPVPQTRHDAFAKTSLGWRTVQVKSGNHLHRHIREVSSEIIALVDQKKMVVKYIPNGTMLPPELPSEFTPICRGLVLLNNPEDPCQSTNTSVLDASEPGSSTPARSVTTRTSSARNATARSNSSKSSRGQRPSPSESTERLVV